jgi:hypothetical protein
MVVDKADPVISLQPYGQIPDHLWSRPLVGMQVRACQRGSSITALHQCNASIGMMHHAAD